MIPAPEGTAFRLAAETITRSPYCASDAARDLIAEGTSALARNPGVVRIIELPSTMSELYRDNTSSVRPAAEKCTLIGLAGWVAWDAADKIRDKGCDMASACIRFSLAHSIMYEAIAELALDQSDRWIIDCLFARMEMANLDESLRHKPSITLTISKSIGADIPFLAFLMKIGASGEDIVHGLDCLEQLILARQLSDDACDWYEDMKAGHRTLVTELLIKNAGAKKNRAVYRHAFEKKIKFKVAQMIRNAARRSVKHACEMSCFTSTRALERLPRSYVEMADKVLAKKPA